MAAEKTLEALSNRLLELDSAIEERNNSRFREVSDSETYEFVESMKNQNTQMKTHSDLKKIHSWLESIGEQRKVESIPSKELDLYLARFFLSVKKKNDKEYEPDTLKAYQANLHRYLADKQYRGNILTVLMSKRKSLKQQGLGNKIMRADPFTDEELEILRKKSLLGKDNPEALTNSMWLNNTLHFGLRGRQEHLQMLWGDLEMGVTSTGREYLAFTERATKTRSGVQDPRRFIPKMFAQPGDPLCPVELYKLYSDKRPEQMCQPESRFYLAVNPHYGVDTNNGRQWFLSGPMGKNKLGQIAKVMSEKAGFTARHVNHSGRKTCITKLLDADKPPTEVAQLSGHKNIQSLNHYNTVSLQKQMEMSSIVHGGRGDNPATSHSSSVSPLNVPGANVSGDYVVDSFSGPDNSVSDEEFIRASQEFEQTLEVIRNYESNQSNNQTTTTNQIIDLPVMQSPGGTVQLTSQRFMPQSLFTNSSAECYNVLCPLLEKNEYYIPMESESNVLSP